MQEQWRDVEGYEGRYEISSYGRLRSYAQDRIAGKIKEGNLTQKGYLTVLLYDGNGHSKWYPVHRLVASAFLPNPNGYPQINHKDENKTNNRIDNLEWCDNRYNCNYGTRTQRAAMSNYCCKSTSRKICSTDRNGNIVCYESIGQAERETGLSHCNIVRALKGRAHMCGEKKWSYE